MADLKDFSQLPAMADETSTIEPVETLPPSDAEQALMAELDKNWEASEENAQPEETDTAKADRERDEAGKFKAKQEKDAADKVEADKKSEKEVKAEAPKPDAVPEEDDEDKQDKKVPKGMHPKAWEGIKARKAELKAAVKERDATIAKLSGELEQAKKVVPFDEEKSKRLKELEDFEFIHSPEKSGKITREFNEKLGKLEADIYPSLAKDVGMPETKAEAQKKFDALDEAGKKLFGGKPQYSLEELKASGGIPSIPFNVWRDQVFNNPNIDARKADKLRQWVSEHFDTSEGRQRALEQAPKDRETWEKQQQEAQQKTGQEYESKARAESTRLQASMDWATEKSVPANATPAQKVEVEAHNKFLKEKMYPAFSDNYVIDTPEKHVKVAMGVGSPAALHWEAEATRLKTEAEQARKEAKEAQDALSKIKGAGRIAQAKSPTPPSKNAPWNKSIDESMAEAGL